MPPLGSCCATGATAAAAPRGRRGLEAGAAGGRGRMGGAANAAVPLAAAARLRSVGVEGSLAGAVPLPGLGGFLSASCRPETAESDARSEVDSVAPLGAPDVGDAPGGARALPADDDPVRASRRTYPPRVTEPGDGCQAADEALAGAWAAIVGEGVIRSGRGKRGRVCPGQLRWIGSAEGGKPSGTLGVVASEDGSSPGERDVRVLTGATAREGVSHSRDIGHEGSRFLVRRTEGAALEVNLLHGGLVKTAESLLEGSPAPEARGKGVLKGE